MSKVEKLYIFQSAPYRNFHKIMEFENLAIHSKSYFDAAQKIYEIENRFSDWWIPAYYSIFHALELAMKSLISKRGRPIRDGHKIIDILYKPNIDLFKFIDVKNLESISLINNGRGQLRYPSNVNWNFYPDIFDDCVLMIKNIYVEIDK